MKREWLGLLLFLCGLFTSPQAWAWMCSTPSSVSGSFGSSSSYAVNSTGQSTSVNLAISCLTLLNTGNTGQTDNVTMRFVTATPNDGIRANMKRIDASSADTIVSTICFGASCNAPTTEKTMGGQQMLSGSNLSLLGTGYNIPITIQTIPAGNISAGTYQTVYGLAMDYSICMVGALNTCNRDMGSLNVNLTLTMIVNPDCNSITAPPLNFGSVPSIPGPLSILPVTQSVSVNCTKGSTYYVTLSMGDHANGNVRNMASGSNLISYEIYKSNGIDRWGLTGTDRWSSDNATTMTVGPIGQTNTYQYVAKVTSTSMPPAGTYTDTLVINVNF